MTTIPYTRPIDRTMQIAIDGGMIEADWTMPLDARGAVIFAHGSGSSRFSRRNRIVARTLYDQKFATLLIDLLTPDEEREDALTASLRFDTKLLGDRLVAATEWLQDQPDTGGLPIGYFGTSTGAAAALLAAARRPSAVKAVVTRGGRPDLADIMLTRVQAPTLLIVGGADPSTIELNRWAFWRLNCERHLEIIPGASHLFEERGAFEAATSVTVEWFDVHLHSLARRWW